MPLHPHSPVEILPYDPSWKEIFQSLKDHLQERISSPLLSIEHIGSTAVPGLVAKPIIDIDIVIISMDHLPAIIKDLERCGYLHEGQKGVPQREAFKRKDSCAPWGEKRTIWMDHHLYVCPKESKELNRHLLFRDYLRERPKKAAEYGELKIQLARKYRDNREKYTQEKTLFIENILKTASSSLLQS